MGAVQKESTSIYDVARGIQIGTKKFDTNVKIFKSVNGEYGLKDSGNEYKWDKDGMCLEFKAIWDKDANNYSYTTSIYSVEFKE